MADHEAKLRAFAFKLTGDQVDADDLYQEAALRMLRNRDKYTEQGNFSAWAHTITRNIFINGYRKKGRQNTDLGIDENLYRIPNKEADAVSSATYDELYQMVEDLPEIYGIPFLMAYQGKKYDEIADELDIALGTVKSRIFFARKKLQARILGDYDVDYDPEDGRVFAIN